MDDSDQTNVIYPLLLLMLRDEQDRMRIEEEFVMHYLIETGGVEIANHRLLPRSDRTRYDHDGALANIQGDYLGPEPLFGDGGFSDMFRISKPRFMKIHDEI